VRIEASGPEGLGPRQFLVIAMPALSLLCHIELRRQEGYQRSWVEDESMKNSKKITSEALAQLKTLAGGTK
jgi:hypothetical protein